MTDSSKDNHTLAPHPEQTSPPGEFIEAVKEALSHIYDLEYLQTHPLKIEETPSRSFQLTGETLRRELAVAVEALNPGPGTPFQAPQARSYNIIRLRYVQGLTIQRTADDLGLSVRQAYRDLRRGEKSIAIVLWTREDRRDETTASAAQLSSFKTEMARLEYHSHAVDLQNVLEQALTAVKSLGQQKGVACEILPPNDPVVLSTDPVVARQVMISLLSHTIQQAVPPSVYLRLTSEAQYALLDVRYDVIPVQADQPAVNIIITQLADRLGWGISYTEHIGGTRTIKLEMMARGPTVLVIDDNEGLVTLITRFLTDQECRVAAAHDGEEGLRLAQEIKPDAIILDVMMPRMDGWELLQRLRSADETAQIPVIICSVTDDPGLAYSLGASLFLPKPINRSAIVSSLRSLGVV